jgi:hypothetical protein
MKTLDKTTETKDIEYIAVRTDDKRSVISRGYEVDKVIQKAKEAGFKFILTYKPAKDQTFIF